MFFFIIFIKNQEKKGDEEFRVFVRVSNQEIEDEDRSINDKIDFVCYLHLTTKTLLK